MTKREKKKLEIVLKCTVAVLDEPDREIPNLAQQSARKDRDVRGGVLNFTIIIRKIQDQASSSSLLSSHRSL